MFYTLMFSSFFFSMVLDVSSFVHFNNQLMHTYAKKTHINSTSQTSMYPSSHSSLLGKNLINY